MFYQTKARKQTKPSTKKKNTWKNKRKENSSHATKLDKQLWEGAFNPEVRHHHSIGPVCSGYPPQCVLGHIKRSLIMILIGRKAHLEVYFLLQLKLNGICNSLSLTPTYVYKKIGGKWGKYRKIGGKNIRMYTIKNSAQNASWNKAQAGIMMNSVSFKNTVC